MEIGIRWNDVVRLCVIYVCVCSLVFLVAIIGLLQRVPLGDGTSRRGQHIRPMTKFSSRSIAAEDDLTDGIGCTNTIVVYNSYY